MSPYQGFASIAGGKQLKRVRRNAHSAAVLPDGEGAAGLLMIGYHLAYRGFHR